MSAGTGIAVPPARASGRGMAGRLPAGALTLVPMLLGCVALGALISFAPNLPPLARLVLAFLLATATALGPIAFAIRGQALQNPAAYYAALSFMYFVSASLAYLGAPKSNVAVLSPSDVANGLLLVSLALFAMWCGYGLAAPTVKSLPHNVLPAASSLPSRALILGTAGVGGLARLTQIASPSFGYLNNTQSATATGPFDQIVATVGFGLELAVVMAAIRVFGGSDQREVRLDRRLLVALALAELAVGFLSGFKGFVLPALIPGLIVFGRYRRRISWKPAIVMGLVLIAFVPLNLNYRELAQESDNTRSAPWLAVTTLAQAPAQVGDFPSMFGEWASTRLRQIDNIAVIVRDTPSVHPSPGGLSLVTDVIATLVPRALSPEKPELDEGGEFARVYFGQPGNIRSSIGATQIGDLYRRFFLPGVVLGLFTIGVVLALLARRLRVADPAGVIVIAFVTEITLGVGGDLITIVSQGLRLMLAVVVVSFLVHRGGFTKVMSDAGHSADGAKAPSVNPRMRLVG